MKNPIEKTMKEVKIDVTFNAKYNKPSNLEERLDFLRNLPIIVYIEKGNKLIANFQEECVTVRPKKDVASYSNYIDIKDCTVDIKSTLLAKVISKDSSVGTYYFYTHSEE